MDRRALVLGGAAGITQLGRRAQPRVTAPELLRQVHVPALASAIVGTHGPPALAAVGVRRADRRERVSETDLWLIGANTQSLTAVLYARMVETNRANWRAKTPELFPDLKIDPAWFDVEVEDFMAHTAGVSDAPVATEAFLAAAAVDRRPLTQQRTDFARLILSAPPASARGQYAYAAANYVLVGAALERATRTSWETAISADLFAPLGMTGAGFGAPTGAEPWGHRVLGSNAVPVNPSGIADDPAVFGPAGRVQLSLADYAAFVRLFLVGGGDYLPPESLRRLANTRGGNGGGAGLGWTVTPERDWAKGPVLSQQTSGGFWSCNVAIGPARGLAVIALCNAGGDRAGGAATERLVLSLLQQAAAS